LGISEKNTKMLVVISKKLKAELESEARKDNRSLSNYVVTILEKRGKQNENQNKTLSQV
jgi:predicted HicB family RNase H-like nuclease